MILPKILRTLELEIAPSAGRRSHLAAGSGLVATGDFLYVVADDEHHLGCFPRAAAIAGRLVRLFPDDLPGEPAQRKAAKPDLEALVHLPASAGYPHGALLAIPSGSKRRRCRGALLRLDDGGAISGEPAIVDFGPLYATLGAHVAALNIEGAVILGDALVLLHRGGKSAPLSALIELPLAELVAGLVAHLAVQARPPLRLTWVDLGTVAGVPLAITDGASLPDGRLVVSAVAERTDNSYADGPCLGAAIALLDRDGRVEQLHPLSPTAKVEGVHAWPEDGRICLLLVTDADDADAASVLLEAELPAASPTR